MADNNKDLVLEHTGDKDGTLNDLKKLLADKKMRYVYFMVRFKKEKRQFIKPLLINYQSKDAD